MLLENRYWISDLNLLAKEGVERRRKNSLLSMRIKTPIYRVMNHSARHGIDMSGACI